jgi:Protein of unknown function (DUF3761)
MQRLLSVLILSVTLVSNLGVPVSSAQNQPTVQAPTTSQNTSTHDTRDNVKCNDNGTYVNSQGQKVKRPENCSGPPPGATAQCRDGIYGFSRNHRGTCSHHGGVAKWL